MYGSFSGWKETSLNASRKFRSIVPAESFFWWDLTSIGTSPRSCVGLLPKGCDMGSGVTDVGEWNTLGLFWPLFESTALIVGSSSDCWADADPVSPCPYRMTETGEVDGMGDATRLLLFRGILRGGMFG